MSPLGTIPLKKLRPRLLLTVLGDCMALSPSLSLSLSRSEYPANVLLLGLFTFPCALEAEGLFGWVPVVPFEGTTASPLPSSVMLLCAFSARENMCTVPLSLLQAKNVF
jgi:hypothetical protein